VIRAAVLALALGLGTIAAHPLRAQEIRDTVVVDTAAVAAPAVPPGARADTIPTRRDTIQPPLSRSELPGTVGISEPYRWRRPQFIGTGALTLLDLVERIPGITSFHTGWLASPMHAGYLGSPARVRVFLDGVEMVPLDPRLGVVADLHDIPLWALEEVSIERGADEVRIHARSWRVERTTTLTRTDFETGDLNTNLYRAFAGRRWRNGAALQGAVEQYASSGPVGRGGGDQLTLQLSGGWASREWSSDVFMTTARRTRDPHIRLVGSGGMPRFRGTSRMTYARVGYGHPEQGSWGQLMAVTRSFREETATPAGAEPVPDSTIAAAQYIAAGGLSVGPLRLSATNRFHVRESSNVNALEGRALIGAGPLSLAARTERRGGGLSSVEEVTATVAPLAFMGLTFSAARRGAGIDVIEEGNLTTLRAEAAVRLGELWMSGGVIRRGEVRVPGLAVFDDEYVAAVDAEATGFVAGARGRIWREVGAAVWMVRWEEAGWYRPQVQVRSQLFVRTHWLSRFPRGNLEILASITHEHRSAVPVPRAVDGGLLIGADVAEPLDFLTSRVEVRLLDAVLFWQQRLAVSPVVEFAPGFVPLQAASIFGVRWNFWN
jgi:hypothetical protein